jgi:hypothetical protein
MSEQTIYACRKRFGAPRANDVKRLRQLEAENARVKKLVIPPMSPRAQLTLPTHVIAVQLDQLEGVNEDGRACSFGISNHPIRGPTRLRRSVAGLLSCPRCREPYSNQFEQVIANSLLL